MDGQQVYLGRLTAHLNKFHDKTAAVSSEYRNDTHATAASPFVPRADEIAPIAEEVISQIQRLRERISETVTVDTATFANGIKPMAELQDATSTKLGMIWNLGYVSPDKKSTW